MSEKGLIFCTLFNKYYFTRGMALYESLSQVCPEFKLYVFAFDDITYQEINKLNKENLIAISLKELEDEALLSVKSDRSFAEYCWTSTSSTVLWVLKNTDAPSCTYIDADLYFYHHPSLLLDEMAETDDVLITSHNYTPRYDQSAVSGKYCVQFMFFRNNENSLKILQWWKDRCIEWCYDRQEDGKFGDQKYLDTWPTLFDGIHELAHPGALAPWNVQQFNLADAENTVVVNKNDRKQYPTIFYHFHGVKYFEGGKFIFAPRSYSLSNTIKKHFYKPYCKRLLAQQSSLSFDGMGTQSTKQYFKDKWLKGHVANFKRNWLKRLIS